MGEDSDGATLYSDIHDLTKEGNELLKSGNISIAIDRLSKAYRLSKTLNDDYLYRSCSFNLGAAHVASGDPSTGVSYLQAAIPPEENGEEQESDGDLYYNLGVGNQMSGNFTEAIANYTRAAECYSAIGNKELEGNTLEKVAFCHRTLGQLNVACEVSQKAQGLFGDSGDTKRQSIVLSNLAQMLAQLGEIEECAKVLNVLLNISQDLDDFSLQAKLFHDVGLVYSSEKCYQSASECFEQALYALSRVPADLQDHQLQGVIFQNLGLTFNHLDQFDKAAEFHQRAVDKFGELGDRKSQSQVFCNLAYAHCQVGDYEAAISSFSHAVQASKDSGDKEGQALATEGLAAAYFRRNDYNQAIDKYKATLALLAAAGQSDTEHAERVVKKLADAVEHQVKSQKQMDFTEQRHKERKPKHVRKMKYGRQRSDRNNRHHSYITRGLASYSEEEYESEAEESDYDDESEESDPADEDGVDGNANRQKYGLRRPGDSQSQFGNGNRVLHTVQTHAQPDRTNESPYERSGEYKQRPLQSQVVKLNGHMVPVNQDFRQEQMQQERLRKITEEASSNADSGKNDKSKTCSIQ